MLGTERVEPLPSVRTQLGALRKPWPFVSTCTSPSTRPFIPKVMIIGEMPMTATPRPFTSPTARPQPRVAASPPMDSRAPL